MERRFLFFLFAFLTSLSAHAEMTANDSPWDQVEKNAWVLTFDGAERPETIIAIKAEGRFYFTSYARCGKKENDFDQVFTWADGEKTAKGITCIGKIIHISTKLWEGRVNPKPVDEKDFY